MDPETKQEIINKAKFHLPDRYDKPKIYIKVGHLGKVYKVWFDKYPGDCYPDIRWMFDSMNETNIDE